MTYIPNSAMHEFMYGTDIKYCPKHKCKMTLTDERKHKCYKCRFGGMGVQRDKVRTKPIERPS